MKPIEDLATFELSDVDRKVLSMRESDFKLQSWDEVKKLVAENRLEQLKRRPSDLAAYITWSHRTEAEHGSILSYILKRRLHWERKQGDGLDIKNPTPFADASDYTILRNDWPYGFEKDVTHLVVWLKTPFEVKEDGDLTEGSRELIDGFVRAHFVRKIEAEDGSGAERVIWFKNWAKLQSVREVEHVHVLVRGVSKEFLKELCKTSADE